MGLTKRKDSYYVEFAVLDDGKVLSLAPPGMGKLKRWKVGSRNKEEAKKQEAIIKTKLMEGLSMKPGLPPVPVSFGEYADRWLNTARGSLAVKTHANYTQLLRLYILPSLKDHDITQLTWGTIKALLMTKQQAGLSVNSVRLMRAVISTILTDAAEEGVIPINPVLGQRRKRRASQITQPDVQPLSWEQKQIFEEELDQMEHRRSLSPAYALLFHVYLKTGMRPGEGRALRQGDIDFHGKRLRVERAATLNGVIKNTKTGETRWVDLSDGLLEKLQSYITWLKAESIADGKMPNWLFPSKSGTLLDENNVNRAFQKVLGEAGLPHFRLYDLRHTYASLLLSSNVPLLYVSHQLGHAKPTITLKYYARWIPSGQVHRVNVLDTANTVITPAPLNSQLPVPAPA
jgi:integrase